MAVAFFLLIFSCLAYSSTLERSIRENWNTLNNPQRVYQLYSLLNFKCLWVCNGSETENLKLWGRMLQKVKHHGLDPKDYLPANDLDSELAHTDALIRLSYHLYYGRVNPAKVYRDWNFPRKPDRVINLLARVLSEGSLWELFEELSPKGQYWNMLEYARFFEDLLGIPWEPIRLTRPLKEGDTHSAVDQIRFRLFLLGDLKEYNPSNFFDAELTQAVKRFQKRHGLPEDGVVFRATLRELNVNPAKRLRQVYMNLEKHRWMPQMPDSFILVNIPSFELFFVNNEKEAFHSRVIVGKNYKDDFRPTPMLYSQIESITVNPKWYVPLSISVKDILPKVQKDPSYLTKKGFRVFHMGEEIDPLQVDWSLYNQNSFPFRLMQESGPQNSLGRIKFNFPNPFDVYLHDTPDRHLFNQHRRAFSSGCIRVEKALDLATYLLDSDSEKMLRDLLKSGKTQTIRLKGRVPIFILYFTAFEREGELHFREDLYEYDRMLERALQTSGGYK